MRTAMLLLLAFTASCATASEPPGFAPGEFLVQFDPETAHAIEAARSAGTFPVTGLPSLDRLCAQYGVSEIERVFTNAQDPEAIKAKFPARSRRIPPGATTPTLSGFYRLRLAPDADVLEAVSVFRDDPHVLSAEPNYLVTVDPP